MDVKIKLEDVYNRLLELQAEKIDLSKAIDSLYGECALEITRSTELLKSARQASINETNALLTLTIEIKGVPKSVLEKLNNAQIVTSNMNEGLEDL